MNKAKSSCWIVAKIPSHIESVKPLEILNLHAEKLHREHKP